MFNSYVEVLEGNMRLESFEPTGFVRLHSKLALAGFELLV